MKRLVAVFGTLIAVAIFLPPVHGGQEEGLWEFSLFGAKGKLDSEDPLALTKTSAGDFDPDGTTTSNGILTRSLDVEDGTFLGVRLGYNWTKTVGSELVYDRNRVGADYHHTIRDLGTGTNVENVAGRVGAVLTSYQIGILFHPLGKWRTAWQPYVTVAGGYMDVDFSPSGQLRSAVGGGHARNTFGVDFEKEDNGIMIGYGVGLKFYLVENVAIRAEARGKSYDLFDERRTDRELSLGISFFVPGAD